MQSNRGYPAVGAHGNSFGIFSLSKNLYLGIPASPTRLTTMFKAVFCFSLKNDPYTFGSPTRLTTLLKAVFVLTDKQPPYFWKPHMSDYVA